MKRQFSCLWRNTSPRICYYHLGLVGVYKQKKTLIFIYSFFVYLKCTPFQITCSKLKWPVNYYKIYNTPYIYQCSLIQIPNMHRKSKMFIQAKKMPFKLTLSHKLKLWTYQVPVNKKQNTYLSCFPHRWTPLMRNHCPKSAGKLMLPGVLISSVPCISYQFLRLISMSLLYTVCI